MSTLCALLITLAHADAQGRYQVLSQETTPDVAGLRIVTIRDVQLDACFSLFILEQVVSPEIATSAVTTAADDAVAASVQRIRSAAAKRDQQLADLTARFERQTGRSHEQWLNDTSARHSSVDPSIVNKYEWERKQIDDEYEQVLREEIPGSYPREVLVPGMRTGGSEDAAEAIRRGLLNPDPRTFADPTGLNGRLESMFKRLIEAPRLAASGPWPCGPASKPLK